MKRILLMCVVVLMASLPLAAADEAMANSIFTGLLAAQVTKDYGAFVANGTDELKAALSKTQFEAASNVLNKRFAGGYEVNLLGELRQRGYQTFLYRLRFTDGGDDILGTLSLKDDKVAGIYFK